MLPRDRGGLLGDALHQVAVGADPVDPRVDDRVARPVPPVGEEAVREGHADRVPDALAERARRRLDPGRVMELGVPRCARPPLAELLQVVQREVVAAEVQRGVLEDARVPRREDEPVASGPLRRGRVVAHLLRVEDVGDGRERHRRARMAGVRLLHRVHREDADRVDRQLRRVRRPTHRANTTQETCLRRRLPPSVACSRRRAWRGRRSRAARGSASRAPRRGRRPARGRRRRPDVSRR